MSTGGGRGVDRTDARTIFRCGVLAGVVPLVGPALVGVWPLALVGVVYVVLASGFLAAAHLQGWHRAGRRQELAVWSVPWLVAVALWTAVLALGGTTDAWSRGGAVVYGVVAGTLSFAVWQLLALGLRHVHEARTGGAAGQEVLGRPRPR